MVNNPEEDILVPPVEYPILEFGDGYIALMQGGIIKIDDEGREVVDMIIRPSMLLRKRYKISDSMLNKNEQMNYKVLKSDLIPINQLDAANLKWMYIKTFDHQETEISKIAWDLRKRLEEQYKRIIILEGQLIWLSDQLNMAKSNPIEFMSQGLEFFERISTKNLEMMGVKRREE